MKKKNKIKFDIISDNSLIIPDYIVLLKNKSKKIIERIESISQLKKIDAFGTNNKGKILRFNKNNFKKKIFYKKKFHNRKKAK